MSQQHLTTITPREVKLLRAAIHGLGIDETLGQALFLSVGHGGRSWIVESPLGRMCIVIRDRECTTFPPAELALSDRLRIFAHAFDDEPLVLSLADDATVVATAGPASAAIDLVERADAWPSDCDFTATASAAVTLRQLTKILWAARCVPAGVDEFNYPAPPMWLGIDTKGLGLHVDWRDFLPSRATYRLAWRKGFGAATVSIPHADMLDFLQQVPIDDDVLSDLDDDMELTVEIGTLTSNGATRSAVCFSAGEWSALFFTNEPLKNRWELQIDNQLDRPDFETVDRHDTEWIVRHRGVQVRLKLHAGQPDIVRVSTVLLESATESIELLRELSQLNAAATGVRHWFEEGTVRTAIDVSCADIDGLGNAVVSIVRATATYAPMLAAFA